MIDTILRIAFLAFMCVSVAWNVFTTKHYEARMTLFAVRIIALEHFVTMSEPPESPS